MRCHGGPAKRRHAHTSEYGRSAERRRSRTYRGVGCTTATVLKTQPVPLMEAACPLLRASLRASREGDDLGDVALEILLEELRVIGELAEERGFRGRNWTLDDGRAVGLFVPFANCRTELDYLLSGAGCAPSPRVARASTTIHVFRRTASRDGRSIGARRDHERRTPQGCAAEARTLS